MTVRINVNKAQRTVLPDDTYVVDIVTCRQDKAKSGAPKLHVEYSVNEEAHPDFAGVKLYSDPSLQEQSWFRILELVTAALGEQPTDEEGNFDFEPEDLLNAQVAVQVSVDDSYDGIPRNKVGAVYAVSELEEGEAAAEEGTEEEPGG